MYGVYTVPWAWGEPYDSYSVLSCHTKAYDCNAFEVCDCDAMHISYNSVKL